LQTTSKPRDGRGPTPKAMATDLVNECVSETQCKMVIEVFIDAPTAGKNDVHISAVAISQQIPTVVLFARDEGFLDVATSLNQVSRKEVIFSL